MFSTHSQEDDHGPHPCILPSGEGEARLPVQYKGVKPDMFQAGVSVMVEGRIGQDGSLLASTLMTSCPSKYRDEKHTSS
jgi:cytochrome c-type biogenesis protein CcmE